MSNVQVTQFLEDDAAGREAEMEVLSFIKKKYPLAYKVEGNHKEYDLEIPEVQLTIEVKYDKESDKTNNYFIETAFNGKPSGINTTTADWWVLVDKDHMCFIPTDSLKHVLKATFAFNRTVHGYDGTRVEFKLLKRDKLQAFPYAKFIPRVH